MAQRLHGLTEKETELVKLIAEECTTTGDVQNV